MSETAPLTPYVMLSELLEDPEMLRPPVEVIPKLAYEGRVTLLAAAEKAGKSTLMGQAAAALVNGAEFFGDRLGVGSVAWVGLDEPTNDLVRRFVRCGARQGIAVFREAPKLGEWIPLLADIRPRLVVVDTITEYAGGFVEDAYRASDWQPLLKVFRLAAEQSGTAFVLLHHMIRAGNRYADSRQLGAGVDVIAEMTEDSGDPTSRKLKVRGRIGREDFTVRFTAGQYELAGGDLSLEMRVYRFIEANPGTSVRAIGKEVVGNTSAIMAAVASMKSRGAIENRGDKHRQAWHVALPGNSPGNASGNGMETADRNGISPYRNASETVGNALGNGSVSGPLNRGRGKHTPAEQVEATF